MDGSDESNCTEFHDDFHSDKTDFPLPIFPKGILTVIALLPCNQPSTQRDLYLPYILIYV